MGIPRTLVPVVLAISLADTFQVDGTELTIFDSSGRQVLRLKEMLTPQGT